MQGAGVPLTDPPQLCLLSKPTAPAAPHIEVFALQGGKNLVCTVVGRGTMRMHQRRLDEAQHMGRARAGGAAVSGTVAVSAGWGLMLAWRFVQNNI